MVLTSWVNVDVKRDMTRVCARVLIEEGGGRSVGNGRMMDLVGFFCPKKRGKRRAPESGARGNVIRPSDDERRTGQEVLPFDSRGANGDASHSDTIYLAIHDSTPLNISSPSPVSPSQGRRSRSNRSLVCERGAPHLARQERKTRGHVHLFTS